MSEPALKETALAAARRAKGAQQSKSVEERIQEARLPCGPADEALIRERALETPEKCLNTYLKAMRGRSRGAAVKAFCQMCMGYVRREIRECSDPACPLYPYRPYQE